MKLKHKVIFEILLVMAAIAVFAYNFSTAHCKMNLQ